MVLKKKKKQLSIKLSQEKVQQGQQMAVKIFIIRDKRSDKKLNKQTVKYYSL